MFVATRSFLSARILSRRICMLSAGLSWATAGPASAARPIAAIVIALAMRFRASMVDRLLGLRMDRGDLRALEPDAPHQALLIEDEGVDPLLQRRRRQVLAESRVEHDQARPRSELPAIALLQVRQRRLVHEEQRVPVSLHA